MPDLTRARLKDQLEFLNIAVDQGVDAAVKVHGETLTAGEALALRGLSAQELTTLRDVNAKIASARVQDVGGLAEEGWTCVNVVC